MLWKPKLEQFVLSCFHCFALPGRSIVMAEKVQRAMDNQPRHFIGKTHSILFCLVLCPIEVDIDFSLQHRRRFKREADNVCHKVMIQVLFVDCFAAMRIHKHNRNLRPPLSQHPRYIFSHNFSANVMTSVCVEDKNGLLTRRVLQTTSSLV
jgi:hypothetical protein